MTEPASTETCAPMKTPSPIVALSSTDAKACTPGSGRRSIAFDAASSSASIARSASSTTRIARPSPGSMLTDGSSYTLRDTSTAAAFDVPQRCANFTLRTNVSASGPAPSSDASVLNRTEPSPTTSAPRSDPASEALHEGFDVPELVPDAPLTPQRFPPAFLKSVFIRFATASVMSTVSRAYSTVRLIIDASKACRPPSFGSGAAESSLITSE